VQELKQCVILLLMTSYKIATFILVGAPLLTKCLLVKS
jgi:hypothetical protein